MREAGWGRIVNFSSTAGKSVSTIGGAHYTAAKAGILGFTRHLSREVAADGITVNAVLPGSIETGRLRSVIESQATANDRTVDAQTGLRLASVPAGRFGAPEKSET